MNKILIKTFFFLKLYNNLKDPKPQHRSIPENTSIN